MHFPACAYNTHWYKVWLLACTYPAMKSFGAIYSHPPGNHAKFHGVKHADGPYKSRDTAKYPAEMCQAIAGLMFPLCSPSQGPFLDADSVQTCIPTKPLNALPISYEDGGELYSEPDWSRPYSSVPDALQNLRRPWIHILLTHDLIEKMKAFFNPGDNQPPFNDHDLQLFRESMTMFIQSHGRTPDWSIRADQPMHLSIIASLSPLLADKDTSLFPMLLERTPTGLDGHIPGSGGFSRADEKTDESILLSIHMTNWPSPASDRPITRDPVVQEFENGKYLEDA